MKYNFCELIQSKFERNEYKKHIYYKKEFIPLKKDKFLIIKKGKISAEIINGSFNYFKITDLSSGEIVAPLFNFDKLKTFSIEFIVTTTQIELLEVDKELFFSKLLTNSNEFRQFFQYISEKTTMLFQKVLFSTMTIEEKFLKYLSLHKDNNSYVEIDKTVTELSKELLITRTALYKIINKLIEKKFLIRVDKKTFKLLKDIY